MVFNTIRPSGPLFQYGTYGTECFSDFWEIFSTFNLTLSLLKRSYLSLLGTETHIHTTPKTSQLTSWICSSMLTLMLDVWILEHRRICGWLIHRFWATSISNFSNNFKVRIQYTFPTNPHLIAVFHHRFPTMTTVLSLSYGHCSNNISVLGHQFMGPEVSPRKSPRIPMAHGRIFPHENPWTSHQQILFSLASHSKIPWESHSKIRKITWTSPSLSWLPGSPLRFPKKRTAAGDGETSPVRSLPVLPEEAEVGDGRREERVGRGGSCRWEMGTGGFLVNDHSWLLG